MSRFQQLRAILLLPVMVMGIVPALVLWRGGIYFAWGFAAPWNFLLVLLSGLGAAIGIALLVQTISLFVHVGQGTLAPWNPTRYLVVNGIYRYVRNPMISGVFCVLLGEVLLFGSTGLVIWLLFFVAANLIYMPLLEEPGLEQRFGQDYVRYKQNVPRWIPRLTPWELPRDEK